MKLLARLSLAGALVLSACSPAEMPDIQLTSFPSQSAADTCAKREQCIIVYVSPWCPSCHATIPLIQDLSRHYSLKSEAGVRVVVGGDSKERIEEMAENFKTTVYLDTEGRFKEAMRFSSVPTWWVIDSKRKIVRRFSGGGDMSDGTELGRARAMDWFITTQLELKS